MKYVANIKVEKVDETGTGSNAKRCVSESLNITVKAGSLNTLKEKVAAHVSLLDEDDL